MKKEKRKYTKEFRDFVIDLVSNGTNITQASKIACDKFGFEYDDTVRRVTSKSLEIKGITDCSEQNVEDSDEFKKAKEREFDRTKNRVIITWCQNETDIHEQFLSNIESYAKAIDASIHVILGIYHLDILQYWYSSNLMLQNYTQLLSELTYLLMSDHQF